MNKLLSIIIPFYNESEDQLFPILASINGQIGINFNDIEIVLVNDCGSTMPSEGFLKVFNNIRQCISVCHTEQNGGPGVARQKGIDYSWGEWVMFCDADDTLQNVAVLAAFIQEIEQSNLDIVTSQWLEELYDVKINKHIYILHDDEMTWMHGKALRKRFLQSKNIKFDEDLRVHEDSYFLAIAAAQTNNVKKITMTTYIWKFISTSITRRNNFEYSFISMPTFIKALGKVFDTLKFIHSNQLQFKITQFIIYIYMTTHQDIWLKPENSQHLCKTEAIFMTTIKPYLQYYYDAPLNFISDIYSQERAKFKGYMEKELLSHWLERLLQIQEMEESK